MGGDLRTLHQEGVRREDDAVAHGDPVVHHRRHAERAARADRGGVGLERIVLLGVALDVRPGIEDHVVPDGDDVLLGHARPVVEQALAHTDPDEPPQEGLEGCAVHQPVHVGPGAQFEEALGAPEVDLVDRAVLRPYPPESGGCPLDEGEVQDGEHQHHQRKTHDRECTETLVQVHGGDREQQHTEDVAPA